MQFDLILYTASGKDILVIGLRRCLLWPFIVTDIKVAIIGAQFSHYYLLVEVNSPKIDRCHNRYVSTG